MKADFPALWAEAPSTLRREPTNAELAGGFPCGPLDLPLFNELVFRLSEIQREIVYAITQSGQTPNANSTTQLWAAMRSISPFYYGVGLGTANAITTSTTPALLAHSPNTIIELLPSASNTGAATIAINGLDAKSIFRADGTPLSSNDIATNIPTLLAYNATFDAYLILGLRSSFVPRRNRILLTGAGAGTWVVPTGVTTVDYVVVGAGSAGNGGTTTISGGGGGAGGTTSGTYQIPPGTAGIPYIIGSGGAAVPSGSYGAAGGSTSFGNFAAAPGAPAGSVTLASGTPGGAAGTGGVDNRPGAIGNDGVSSSSILGGAGANGPFGGGGRAGTPSGVSGNAPGAGGGGSYYNGTSVGFSGAGADGGIELRW